MCEGGYDGLSQCALNQELNENDRWHSKMLLAPQLLPQYSPLTCSYRWIPAQINNSWTSVKGLTWAGAFQAQLESEFPAARGKESNVWMRRMSDILSMPMTVLYGLEFLRADLDWAKKDILTIHVGLGAFSITR
jgi:hypothetical protein